MKDIVGRVWLYVVVGIAVGAGIHGYVPASALVGIMGKQAWWSVPAAVIIGIPLYSNAAGVIPIVSALLEKGASLGTVLAFMMSGGRLEFAGNYHFAPSDQASTDCNIYRYCGNCNHHHGLFI